MKKTSKQRQSFSAWKTALPLAWALIALFTSPTKAEPSAGQITEEARALAASEDYESAAALLRQGIAEYPESARLQLELARVYGWQGKYAEAENIIAELERQTPGNPDVSLVAGYLAYYQGYYAQAQQRFASILENYPGYEDAENGLANAQRALAAQDKSEWRSDTGFEWSHFERQDRANWFNSFTQLSHQMSSGETVLHGRVERFDQFETIDTYYQAGIDHRFTERLYGYVHAGFTAGADFRPQRRLLLGGGYRLTPVTPHALPVWLTLDLQHDKYKDTEVSNFNPGLRINTAPGWALAAKLVTVKEAGLDPLYGWSGRLDGKLTDSLAFYGGYANAPEAVAARVVDTATLFGGIRLDLSTRHTLRLGYARDDRENSYIRHALSASFSVAF